MPPAFHAIALVISLAACGMLAPAEPQTKSTDSLVLNIDFTPPDTCRVSVDGRSFQLPADEQPLLESLGALKNGVSGVRVAGNADIPYRCVGHAIFVAQRAGFEQIGFTAEPPE